MQRSREARLRRLRRIFQRAVQRGSLLAAFRYVYWHGYQAGYYDMSHDKPVRPLPAERAQTRPTPHQRRLF